MELIHFIIFVFFVSIVLYLALKNGGNTVNILNAGGSQIIKATSTLQGR